MGKDELISQMNEFVWRLFFVSHTWNIHNIEINAGEATAGLGVANLNVSEAALTFFGFYNLTLVGEIMTSRPPERSIAIPGDDARHERLMWAWVLGKCFYTRKSGHWNHKQATGALKSLYNTLCYFTILCCFKVLVENH